MVATSSGTWRGLLGTDGGDEQRRGGEFVCMSALRLFYQEFSVKAVNRGT